MFLNYGNSLENCSKRSKNPNETFRLHFSTQDGAEYLFSAQSESEMKDWIQKVAYHAALPPSMQLKPFEDRHREPEHHLQHEIESVQEHTVSRPSMPPPVPPPFTPEHPRDSTNDSGFMSPADQSRRTVSECKLAQ